MTRTAPPIPEEEKRSGSEGWKSSWQLETGSTIHQLLQRKVSWKFFCNALRFFFAGISSQIVHLTDSALLKISQDGNVLQPNINGKPEQQRALSREVEWSGAGSKRKPTGHRF